MREPLDFASGGPLGLSFGDLALSVFNPLPEEVKVFDRTLDLSEFHFDRLDPRLLPGHFVSQGGDLSIDLCDSLLGMAAGVVKIVRRNRPATHLADRVRPWSDHGQQIGDNRLASAHVSPCWPVCRYRPHGIVALFGRSCLGIDQITLRKNVALLLLDICDLGSIFL